MYSNQIPGVSSAHSSIKENGGRNSIVSAVSNSAIQVEPYVTKYYVASINYSNYQQQPDQKYRRIQRSFNSAQHIPKPLMQQRYQPSINNQCTTNYENLNPENSASDGPNNIFANDYSPVPFADPLEYESEMDVFEQDKSETITHHQTYQTNAANAVVQKVPIAPMPSTSVTVPKRATSIERMKIFDIDRTSNSGESADDADNEQNVERRTVANERERKTAISMKDAYTSLQNLIPPMNNNNENLSKFEILNTATNYIVFLSEIVRCPTAESDTLQENPSGTAIAKEAFADAQNEKLMQAFNLWMLEYNGNS